MKKMKKIILPITFMFLSSLVFSQTDEAEYEKVLEQSPFNKMYPQFMAKEAADYFKEFNKLFTEHLIEKTYLAWVEGTVTNTEFSLEQSFGRNKCVR